MTIFYVNKPASLVVIILSILSLASLTIVAMGQRTSSCSFTGLPLEQAQCLLRPVRKYGEVGPQRPSLPAPLDRLIGQPTEQTVSQSALSRYLVGHQIKEAEIGGALSSPVSQSSDGRLAVYFIIHDTSSPALEKDEPFPPADMDSPDWSGNDLNQYLHPTDCPARRRNPQAICRPVAHVFINRLGQSATGHDFQEGWRSTQYELQSVKRRGLFLAVENIQPRRKDHRGIDAEAPSPGFTDAQLDRLALVYIAASVRRRQWLIPAFHGVIDLGAGTHDDPQNFDLNHWAERLNLLLQSIQ
jgi:hypothetical protein